MLSSRPASLVRVAAMSQQAVKAPIKLYTTEGRYATALYCVSKQQSKLAETEKDIEKVKSLMKTNAKFSEFVKSPLIKRTEKQQIMDEVMKKVGVGALTYNMFDVMGENNRLGMTEEVIAAFDQLTTASRGEVVAVVTTADSVDGKTQEEIKQVLLKFLKPGENLQLQMKTDASIIGGMVVQVGDRFIDLSIATKKRKLDALLDSPV